MSLNFPKTLYKLFPESESSDFVVGKDSFEDVQINSAPQDGFWYFKNIKKSLIKRFILQKSPQVWKICVVTLVKGVNGKFSPRFDFQILNITQKAIQNFSKESIDQNLIKAKVCFDSCHENFSSLLNFIKSLDGQIDLGKSSYCLIEKEKKDIFDNITREDAIVSFTNKYGNDISEKDISLLQDRRAKLEYFKNLLYNNTFFEVERRKLEISTGTKKTIENVWQIFFEDNRWIFGYGLQLVACDGLDDRKLEQVVVGNDIIDGSGKRIDAFLKTRGNISKILFCEIKTHLPNILVETYDRPGVYVPRKELRGAVAQIQKTIHKTTLKVQDNYLRINKPNGEPTGEELLYIKPRGIVVIGKLDDFSFENGINYEKLSSFEIYRQQINGIEIITYDELYERAKFIVES